MHLQRFSLKLLPKIKIYLVIIFLTLLSLVFFYYGYNKFQVKNVEILSDNHLIKTNIIGLVKNKNLILLSVDQLQTEILLHNPQIGEVIVHKIYPNKLSVQFKLDYPIAYLKANLGFFALNYKGKIIYKKKLLNDNLPIINYYQKFDYLAHNPSDVFSYSDIQAALYFLQKIQELGISVSGVDIVGLDMVRFNLKEKIVNFTSQKDKSRQEYEFITLYKQFKIEGRDFKSLDLRFDKPIVGF